MKKEKTKKSFWQDFKAFISKGNILDLAIGVIIGGAFGKIVSSLVSDIIMPFVGLAVGQNSLAGLCVVLNGVDRYVTVGGVKAVNPDAILWNYGNFLQNIIDFLIIALCVFLFMKLIIKFQKLGHDVSLGIKKVGKKDETAVEAAPAPVVEAAPVAASPAPAAPVAPVAAVIEAVPAASEKTEALLEEIRDLLKTQAKKE